MSWWDDQAPAVPVAGGLVGSGMVRGTRIARDARGVGAAIVTRLVERVNADTATRGRTYARNGQTISMTIESGQIEALIQGSADTPYAVTISGPVPAEHRTRLIAAFNHALTDPTAGIPARDNPALREEIDACELLTDVAIVATCTCPQGAVCKHCIALAYVAADRLDGSPIALANFFGVRNEDLGVGTVIGTPVDGASVTVFDPLRQAQLARKLFALDARDTPTLESVFGDALKILPGSAAVLAQLAIESAEPSDRDPNDGEPDDREPDDGESADREPGVE